MESQVPLENIVEEKKELSQTISSPICDNTNDKNTRTPTGVVEISPYRRYIRFNDIIGTSFTGSFATSFKAFDTTTAIEVDWHIIEITNNDSDRIKRFVLALKDIQHAHIQNIQNTWLITESMKFNVITAHLPSLKEFMGKKGMTLRWKVVKKWCSRILRGLDYLHSSKIVHRNLTCSNIFINGGTGDLCIGGTWLGAILTDVPDQYLSFCDTYALEMDYSCTPAYVAPETFTNSILTTAVDIYSFGICTLEIITREEPYRECQDSVGRIAYRATNNILPMSLSAVTHPHALDFIKLCLHSERPSAAELLQHPFLIPSELEDDEEINIGPTSYEADTISPAFPPATDPLLIHGEEAFVLAFENRRPKSSRPQSAQHNSDSLSTAGEYRIPTESGHELLDDSSLMFPGSGLDSPSPGFESFYQGEDMTQDNGVTDGRQAPGEDSSSLSPAAMSQPISKREPDAPAAHSTSSQLAQISRHHRSQSSGDESSPRLRAGRQALPALTMSSMFSPKLREPMDLRARDRIEVRLHLPKVYSKDGQSKEVEFVFNHLKDQFEVVAGEMIDELELTVSIQELAAKIAEKVRLAQTQQEDDRAPDEPQTPLTDSCFPPAEKESSSMESLPCEADHTTGDSHGSFQDNFVMMTQQAVGSSLEASIAERHILGDEAKTDTLMREQGHGSSVSDISGGSVGESAVTPTESSAVFPDVGRSHIEEVIPSPSSADTADTTTTTTAGAAGSSECTTSVPSERGSASQPSPVDPLPASPSASSAAVDAPSPETSPTVNQPNLATSGIPLPPSDHQDQSEPIGGGGSMPSSLPRGSSREQLSVVSLGSSEDTVPTSPVLLPIPVTLSSVDTDSGSNSGLMSLSRSRVEAERPRSVDSIGISGISGSSDRRSVDSISINSELSSFMDSESVANDPESYDAEDLQYLRDKEQIDKESRASRRAFEQRIQKHKNILETCDEDMLKNDSEYQSKSVELEKKRETTNKKKEDEITRLSEEFNTKKSKFLERKRDERVDANRRRQKQMDAMKASRGRASPMGMGVLDATYPQQTTPTPPQSLPQTQTPAQQSMHQQSQNILLNPSNTGLGIASLQASGPGSSNSISGPSNVISGMSPPSSSSGGGFWAITGVATPLTGTSNPSQVMPNWTMNATSAAMNSSLASNTNSSATLLSLSNMINIPYDQPLTSMNYPSSSSPTLNSMLHPDASVAFLQPPQPPPSL